MPLERDVNNLWIVDEKSERGRINGNLRAIGNPKDLSSTA